MDYCDEETCTLGAPAWVWRIIADMGPPYICEEDRELGLLAGRCGLSIPSMRKLLKQARGPKGIPSKQKRKPPRNHRGCFVVIRPEGHVEIQIRGEIQRGLLIKKKWIDLMLSSDAKTWEIRTFSASLGLFYLIETKDGRKGETNKIRGHANLVQVEKKSKQYLNTAGARKKHKIDKTMLDTYVKAHGAYVWHLDAIAGYDTPPIYQPALGCTTWCTEGLGEE